ncbi:MAG: helix-turn-helix domain-containing protein [Victivallales bacterium]
MNFAPSRKKNQLPDSLNRALEFIARNLYDPGLSRERIAVHCGVSVRTLSRLFHSELDTQPAQYILRLRLEQVRNMLALPRLSIKEIAEQCGFRSAGFLARQFRRHCRMTPRAYRDTICRLP